MLTGMFENFGSALGQQGDQSKVTALIPVILRSISKKKKKNRSNSI